MERSIETFKVKIPTLAKKICLKNYCNLEDEVVEIPDWINKFILSIDQKNGKIKNDMSTGGQKKKKKVSANEST